MKRKILLPLASLTLIGGLFSCKDNVAPKSEKVHLSFGSLFDEEASNPNEHFYQNGITNVIDDVEVFSYSPYAPRKKISSLIDKKESFLLVVVHEESCTCWTGWRNNCLIPYMKETNARIYLALESELDVKVEGVSYAESLGIELGGYDVMCIFSKGKLKYQKMDKLGSKFHDSYANFKGWMNEKVSHSQLMAVNKNQLDALYNGDKDFSIYYGRESCGDCGFYETHFLFDYLEKNKLKEDFYYINCDVVGIRYEENGKYDSTSSLWPDFKSDYGLAYGEDNPGGFGSGYVPTILRISPDNGKKIGSVIKAVDVYFNDSFAKQEDETWLIQDSYFDETRLDTTYLSYLKNDVSIPNEKKVFKGVNLGKYEGESSAFYSWYQEKASEYHNEYAKAFINAYLK